MAASLPSGPSGSSQTNNAGDVTITPTSQLHTEDIVFTGAARTTNVIIQTAGLDAGARIDIVCNLSAADDTLILNIKNANGTTLFSFAKAGGEPNGVFRVESTGYGGLRFKEAIVPAYVSY
jgi:hypothetical protein